MSAIVKSTWLLIPILLLLHQDYWLWEETELIWGFIPAGFFSHLCISVLASVSWLLICIFHWPKFVDGPDLPTEANVDKPSPNDAPLTANAYASKDAAS